jgi:hypothetical protein
MPESPTPPPLADLAADLERWLATLKKRSPVARLELLKVGYPGVTMTWSLEGAGNLGELAEEIQALAEHEGRSSASPNGRAIFRVRAIDGNGSEFAQRTFAVASAPTGAGIEAPIDPAVAFSQVAKAYNDLTQIVTRAFQGRDDAWQRQNELLLAQNVQLRAEHFAVLRRWQENVVMQSEQKRLDAMLLREEERDEFMLNQAKTILAVVANRIGGGGPGKGAPAASQLLTAMFEQFTPQQIDFLMGPTSPLDTNQKSLLGELYQSLVRPKETPLNRGTNGTPNPEDVS